MGFDRSSDYVNVQIGSLMYELSSVMDFLVNKMDWEPAAIARYPTIILRSLEKKIIPQCSVVKILQMKGLVKLCV